MLANYLSPSSFYLQDSSQMLIASKCLSIICQSIWADKYVLRWMCDNLNMSNKCECYEMSNAQRFVDEITSFLISSQLKEKCDFHKN